MLKHFNHLGIALLLITSAASGDACAATTLSSTVSATVLDNIAITNQSPLNFGSITPGANGGTVTVSPSNTQSSTGSVSVTGAFARAIFAVHGTPGQPYSIHTPATLTFTAQEPNNDPTLVDGLTVQNFATYSVNIGGTASTGQLNGFGTDNIFLGGTLIVPLNAAPGTYSGLVPLTVSY